MTKNHFFMSLFWTLFDHLFTKITYFSLALKTQAWVKSDPKRVQKRPFLGHFLTQNPY